jgi:hypothetical protein
MEIASCHSIPSSASASSVGGTLRPSARGLEVDHQVELGWLLDRKVGWLRTLKDSFNVGSSPTIQVDVIWAIRDQCAIPGRWRKSIYRRQAMIHRGTDEPISVPVCERAGLNDDRPRLISLHRRFGDVANTS